MLEPPSLDWQAVTVLFYIKAVSALRRLSASEYHAHPDQLRRQQRRQQQREHALWTEGGGSISATQMMPMRRVA